MTREVQRISKRFGDGAVHSNRREIEDGKTWAFCG
jgi:hypothetical protein